VYLIEPKWTNSGELDEASITLRREQVRRHQIFRAYLDAWRQDSYADWLSFVAGRSTIALRASSGPSELFHTAPAGSLLARNLTTILRRCAVAGPAIEDVLLVVHPQAGSVVQKRKNPNGFSVVELQCPEVQDGYVILNTTTDLGPL
jgi:hypothetical protein